MLRLARNLLILAVAQIIVAGPVEAQWRAQVRADEITDIRSVTLSLPALGMMMGTISPVRPTMHFTCQQGAVEALYINVDVFVTSPTPVYLRFDGGTPIAAGWGVSTDNKALFARPARGIVDSLLVHDRLIFRFTPYRDSDQTTSFQLGGLPAHDAALKKYCGFTVAEAKIRIQRTVEERRIARTRSDAAARGRAIADTAAAREERLARARGRAMAEEVARQNSSSSDSTLPWVSGVNQPLYFKNTPECRAVLAVHRSWWLFWTTEGAAKGSGRSRSRAPGC